MTKITIKTAHILSAAFIVGVISGMPSGAFAAPAGGNTFSTIASNIVASLSDIPGLLSAIAYLFGILIGVLGILKIKDHVENPSQTPLKDGAIRLAAGGALFALPIVFEAMYTTIGTDGNSVGPAPVNGVIMNVIGK